MPAPHICTEPGCPTLVTTGRCKQHARPSARARGYDRAHDLRRQAAAPHVAAGTVACWRCGERIAAGEQWDLGHDDGDRSITRGPEHMTCNRSAAGRASHDRH